jgi:UDP-N-acetylmuramyl pentapeptide phosphotransferase/UDP-N-acetylglucosamine-1-phosphate transferase
MLYHLALYLLPDYGALNVLTYHTVRAGGAALTAFLLCVITGPWAIRMLKSLKIGQYIRKDHVAELHELHKGKSGTPTMGGAMFIISTITALLLWSTLQNRLMWVAVLVFVLLGAVGFLDDYTKLKRKQNAGLTARAKFAGQILCGSLLGLYLYFYPVAYSAGQVEISDVTDWPTFIRELSTGADLGEATPAGRVWALLPVDQQAALADLRKTGIHELENEVEVRRALRDVLRTPNLYDAAVWPEAGLSPEAKSLAARNGALSDLEQVRFNRLLLEGAFPKSLAASSANRHTSVGVPGFKDWFIPLGIAYIALIIFIIVGTSNAVNLTDGLDGLAAGTAMISIIAFSAIAYAVSRADWSSYLFVTYVPEASELFVFGAALLGAGLGFLWYNAHPAEVFMGDTGSLALGGAIATLAILTKQELLLPIVAGLFVIEASSVIIQVGYFKLTGRRFFRMAPLHHHFELLGWSETKVTMRFWIVAFLLAMLSLATLKLR